MAQISTVRETRTQSFFCVCVCAGNCVRTGQRNIKFLWKVVTGHKMQSGGHSGDATRIAGEAGQHHEPLLSEMLVAVGETYGPVYILRRDCCERKNTDHQLGLA